MNRWVTGIVLVLGLALVGTQDPGLTIGAASSQGASIPLAPFDSANVGRPSDLWVLPGGIAREAPPQTWTNTEAPNAPGIARPSARGAHAMAYDAESDRVILFAGDSGVGSTDFEILSDTWVYDFNSNSWEEREPATAPPPRAGHAMAYDSKSDRVVVFGGFTGVGVGGYNDTWTYDFNTDTWTQKAPATSPSVRWGARMAYDAASDRVILLGGHRGSGSSAILFNDTWSYDVSADVWTLMDPIPGSGVANWHAMVYDTGSDKVVRFGGDTGVALTSETASYDFDNDTWTVMNPVPRPNGRWFHAMAHDQGSDLVVLFGGSRGGTGGSGGDNQTWVYDLDGDAWTQRHPTVPPSGRLNHAVTYDAESDRVILFGGDRELFFNRNNETWAYDDDNETWTPLLVLPTAPLDLRASEGDGRVELDWGPPRVLGGPPASVYRIYRSSTTEPWSLLDAIAGLAFVDVNVTNGVQYFYHTRAVSALGEGPRSNVVPATPTDVTLPLVVITSPTDGATLANTTVTVSGTATDNTAIDRVEIRAGEASWFPATGKASWSGTLTLAEGSHTIHARVFDTFGNIGTASSVSVEVRLPSPPTPDDLPLMIAVIAIGLGGAAAAAFLLIRRGRLRRQ